MTDSSEHKAPRVLVIDDSRSAREYVRDLLENKGCQVDLASSGEEGIGHVAANAPDVVLLDIEMPEFDGMEVLEFLSTTKHLYSIILFTTRTSLESMIEGLNGGADDYITKPFSDGELIARINAAVRTARLKRELSEAKERADRALEELRLAQSKLEEQQKASER